MPSSLHAQKHRREPTIQGSLNPLPLQVDSTSVPAWYTEPRGEICDIHSLRPINTDRKTTTNDLARIKSGSKLKSAERLRDEHENQP